MARFTILVPNPLSGIDDVTPGGQKKFRRRPGGITGISWADQGGTLRIPGLCSGGNGYVWEGLRFPTELTKPVGYDMEVVHNPNTRNQKYL